MPFTADATLARPGDAWQNTFNPAYGRSAVEFDGPPGPFALYSTFEAFVPGEVITASGAVAPGDNKFASTTVSGGNPVAVPNPVAHGALAMMSTCVGSEDNCAVSWGGTATVSISPARGYFPVITQPVYFRFYVYLCGYPNVTPNLLRLAPNPVSGAGAFNIQILSNGTVRPTYQNNAQAATAGTIVPPWTWLRMEGWTSIDPNFAQCQLLMYYGDSVTPFYNATSAASFSQNPIQAAFFGILGGSASTTYNAIYDDLAFGNTGLFGPSGTGIDDFDQPLSAQVSPSFQVAQQPWRKPQVNYDYSYSGPGLLFQNNFESGTPATAITNTNSRGTGQSGFAGVANQGAGGSLTYDATQAAHGLLSMLVNNPSAASTNVNWSDITDLNYDPATGALPSPGLTCPLYFRFYVFLTGYPASSSNFLVRITPGNNGISITSAGQLGIIANGSTPVAGTLSPGPVPLNTWIRVEGSYQPGVGVAGAYSYTAYFYDSLTPIWPTVTLTGRSTGGQTIQNVFLGNPSPNAAMPYFWMDDVAVSTTGLLGPAGSNVTIADQPLSAQVSPAWRTAFTAFRQPVEGYADAQYAIYAGSATAYLNLTAPGAGQKVGIGSASALIVLSASELPMRIYNFRATAAGGFWSAQVTSGFWQAQAGGSS
jgi:hypothetical protein